MSIEMPEQFHDAGSENKKLPIGRLEEGEKIDAFARKMELFIRATFGNVEVVGEENLDSIPSDRRVVFITTHITNSDIPLGVIRARQKIPSDRRGRINASRHIGKYVRFCRGCSCGRKKFIPISRRKVKDAPVGSVGIFDPEDFDEIETAFDKNKAVILSAYYISHNKDLRLPQKGGYGAAYLAEMADAVIVPVAADVKSEEYKNTTLGAIKVSLSRPDANVIIGEPFELKKMKDISAIKEIMKKREQENF